MNFPRKLGLLMILVAVGAALADHYGLSLPSLRWFYSFEATPREIQDATVQQIGSLEIDWPWIQANRGRIVGHAFCGLIALTGLVLLVKSFGFHWNPQTVRKLSRFRSIGRGYVSFRLLMVLVGLCLLDQVLVGKKALAVEYQGQWHFPAFVKYNYKDRDFGGDSEEAVDFRQLKERLGKDPGEGRVIMPPVPWDPTFDSDEEMRRRLVMNQEVIFTANGKEPYNGFAVAFQEENPDLKVRGCRVRSGLLDGPAQVYDEEGSLIGREEWRQGKLVSSNLGEDFESPDSHWVQVIYMPLPPSLETGHLLGTNSNGWDILALLFGGMQVLFKASFLYIVLTYLIGITIGSLMGYFGGLFDLVMQRVMEVMSNIPFLLVVMIIIINLGKDKITLGSILLILCIFSWIGVATYLRTATYKEKARDYVNAARVLGSSTPRVIFRHILPNVIATIVTLIPFSVSSVISALTALDFLGFGLPERYPSWGRLLKDGVDNLGSPWIVSSIFVVMVFVLLLVTFVGEAVREAYDPRKFTTYQ